MEQNIILEQELVKYFFIISKTFWKKMSIGKRLKHARKSKGLTLEKVSKKTGLSKGNISLLENDKYAPSSKALISLSKLYNVDLNWLLTGEGSIYRENNISRKEELKKEIEKLKHENSELQNKLLDNQSYIIELQKKLLNKINNKE